VMTREIVDILLQNYENKMAWHDED
jgi:hypothetical protein